MLGAEAARAMWLLGGAPIFVFVLGAGLVAFGAAVSYAAFHTKGAFRLSTLLAFATLGVGALAWWHGRLDAGALAPVPFQIAAGITIGAGLVIVLGEAARGRRPPDE